MMGMRDGVRTWLNTGNDLGHTDVHHLVKQSRVVGAGCEDVSTFLKLLIQDDVHKRQPALL